MTFLKWQKEPDKQIDDSNEPSFDLIEHDKVSKITQGHYMGPKTEAGPLPFRVF